MGEGDAVKITLLLKNKSIDTERALHVNSNIQAKIYNEIVNHSEALVALVSHSYIYEGC